eukprot:8526652-Pyramimonas_sp.AAC.3
MSDLETQVTFSGVASIMIGCRLSLTVSVYPSTTMSRRVGWAVPSFDIRAILAVRAPLVSLIPV